MFLGKVVLKIFGNFTRTIIPKCYFSKVAKQLYWNRTSAWVFSCKFDAYFQNTFSAEHLWVAASQNNHTLGFFDKYSKKFLNEVFLCKLKLKKIAQKMFSPSTFLHRWFTNVKMKMQKTQRTTVNCFKLRLAFKTLIKQFLLVIQISSNRISNFQDQISSDSLPRVI